MDKENPTVSDVVDIATAAWRSQVVGTPISAELQQIGDDFAALVERHDCTFGAIMAMMAAFAAAQIRVLHEMADGPNVSRQEVELVTPAAMELIRRALTDATFH